jgi:phage-related tail protein
MVETENHSPLLNELKRHLDIVAESLESKIQLVAEGVVNVDQKLDRRFDALKQEIEKESEETRALIRLSYTELDRRLTTLEGTVAALQSRVDAIEAQNN